MRHIKHDMWGILLRAIPEIPGLRLALVEGRVDGSTYSGECACLCGTIANIRKCDFTQLDYRDSHSLAERWFFAIGKGQTPENNSACKLAVEWIDEFTALIEAGTNPAA
ncbi:hypothetical protein [Devosia sp. CN2-171]|uniref:hypothetical protein n=1 Tax=Devosia sp. CN2-171 TaxID=3400909 RepID=UPI003BF89000